VVTGSELPKYQTSGSAGFDLAAAESKTIAPGAVALVKTDLKVAVPEGYELQVRSRSGLALKNGVFVLNSPGTVDADYRGTVGVILANFGHESFVVAPGDRIAQGVINKVEQVSFVKVDSLDATERGAGGFGSTGV
jgi:dUTP pyrophosphatase